MVEDSYTYCNKDGVVVIPFRGLKSGFNLVPLRALKRTTVGVFAVYMYLLGY